MLTARMRGQAAEEAAAKYLQQQGLRQVESNFTTKTGEIDLIMRDAETLVFVEVRYRNTNAYGLPQATVDHHKQRKLIKTAHYYLQTHKLDVACRFDVIAISGNLRNIEWIKNAFSVV